MHQSIIIVVLGQTKMEIFFSAQLALHLVQYICTLPIDTCANASVRKIYAAVPLYIAHRHHPPLPLMPDEI